MIQKVLVIGGTGMLGSPVVWRLHADDFTVRVMTHSPEKAKKIIGNEMEVVVGDVTDPASLSQPISDCDAIYLNLSAKMDPCKYESVERRGAANVARVAAEHNVRRIAMISELGVDSPDSPFPHLAAKAGAEQALKDSGVSYTILRCCWFMESLPLFVQENKAYVIGRQPHLLSWLATSDYAGMVSNALRSDAAANRVFHVRGIEKMTIREALTIFCGIVYPKVKIATIPLWMLSLGAKLGGRREMKGFVNFMKYSDRHMEPEVSDDSDRILGPALTTIADWAEEYKKDMLAEK
ncbi:MAG: NAD(P)H-binding protein [Candidatus Zixiibacteriota bacterium]|nr:MAG: NAD(P)H-binding protein [candidate division Zixibacteria bacterium]